MSLNPMISTSPAAISPLPTLNNNVPSWKSATLNYLGDLLLTTVSTVTPLAVGFAIISYIHRYYNSDRDRDGLPKENRETIRRILKKWNLNLNDLKLNEHEWTIAMNIADPDSLIGLSWSDVAGCGDQIEKLKNFVVLPLMSKLNNPNLKKPKSGLSKSILQTPKGVLIHGVAGVGKTLLAKVFAKETNCRLLTIDPSKMNGKYLGDAEKLTAALFTLAEKLEPCVVFVDEIDGLLKSRASYDGNNVAATKGIFLSYWDGLATDKTVLILGTTNRPKDIDSGFLRRFDLNLELELPDVDQRKSILELYLKNQKEFIDDEIQLDELAYDMNGFSGADIKEICRQGMITATDDAMRDSTPVKIQDKHFIKAIADSKRSRNSCGGFGGLNEYEMKIASSLLTPEDLDVEWEDVAGLDEIIQRLSKNVIQPLLALRNPDVMKSGLIQPPKGILLHGSPGCGKTLLAKAIAKYVNCAFINLLPSDLQGNLYGETSRNVRAVFTLAEKYQPCIIFIDEIDALFRKRNTHDHETSSIMKTCFMSLWDGILSNSSHSPKNIIILGATNRPETIDTAIMRRLPEKIHIPMPNATQREMILKAILKHEVLESDNLTQLAELTDGFSGSDLKEICRNAAINSLHSSSSSPPLQMKSLSKTGAGDIKKLSKQVDLNIVEPTQIPIKTCHFEAAVAEFLASKVK